MGPAPGLTAAPVAVALAVVLSAGTASALSWPAPPPPVAAPSAAGSAVVASVERSDAERPAPPVAVAVPALGVTSALAELGLNPDRSLQVPADPQLAGWYTGASRPGEPGPVVVVGHVDSYRGPGVFARLRELQPGDRVELQSADGGLAAYAVTAVRQVPKDAFPTQEVYGAVEGDELRLITCGGEFDRAARSYRDNVVVSAVRI